MLIVYNGISDLMLEKIFFKIMIYQLIQIKFRQYKSQMLGNVIMISGMGLLSASFVLRRKESYFKEMYDQIQRAKKFHLDFVDELGKLPVDQNIILFGPPKSETNQQKILCTSIIKRGPIEQPQKQGEEKKEFTFPKEDRLWKFSLKEPFYMQTLSNQKILVEEEQNAQLYAFNLMRRNSNQKYQQRVIVKNEPVCAYGKIVSSGGKIKFKTSLIMGTKNQNFLTYLDKEIIGLRSKGKFLTIAGISLFGVHMLYHQFFKQFLEPGESRSKTLRLIENSQEQKILSEIKNFQNKHKV